VIAASKAALAITAKIIAKGRDNPVSRIG